MNQPATAGKHYHKTPNHTKGVVSGKWQVASGKWQVASGKWQMASGEG